MSNEELVNDTLISLKEFLPNVILETRNTAELFHSDREATALGKLVHLIDAYSWIIDAVSGMKNLGYVQQLNFGGITNFLKDIEQAMSIQDFVAVSDILEYEIAEIFENWNKELNEGIGEN
ncbi:hypothetical protein ABES03_18640 [Neobacillus rhizosphaerae]|uniref:hypothetical protein n=1 Tax=Neobacillus rhizosphaerae TaxID=2880965 RepID=UPI003D2C2D75